MKKTYPILIASVLIMSLMSLSVDVTSSSRVNLAQFPRNNMAPLGPYWMDATVDMLGEEEIMIRKLAAQIGPAAATGTSPIGESATIGEELTISVSDFFHEIVYDETFVVILEGTHGILLVEKAAYDNYDGTTDEYVFPNPNGMSPPPNPFYRVEDRISTAQLAYILDQFDTVIYPTVTTVFGEPLPRGDEGQKTWILIHNIRDTSYYDPSSWPYFTAGYFSASEDAVNNKNMMHVDSFNWAEGTGPSGERPYFYEGCFAHEFEHLVHFDQDPDEPSWVDEGLADLAMLLCGYGQAAEDHLAFYMVYHPMTALTFWGDNVWDYGASYLFQLYLYEQYGGSDFISALVQEQANGIEGIEKTLAAFHYRDSFDTIFDRWTIANYLDDTRKGGGKYGYESIDIGTMDTWGYTIEYALYNLWVGPPFEVSLGSTLYVSSDWFFGMEPLPYTAHYVRINCEEYDDYKVMVSLDGDDFSGTTAYSGTYEWYSDAEAWAWRSFYQTFDIPAGGATLNFRTFYEIEQDWDYGYVEVYDHNTDEWHTLDAPGTVDYLAHLQDNPNTPAGREPADYEAAGRWHAFTDYSGGWIPVSMDLSPFAGHTIDLYFSTWQDGAFTLQMMYVDDISIPEIGFFDDIESGEGDWISTGWYITDGIRDNDFGVTAIDTKWVPIALYPEPARHNAMQLHHLKHMTVEASTQSGTLIVPATPIDSGRVQVIIVSNRADHILTSHYDLTVGYDGT